MPLKIKSERRAYLAKWRAAHPMNRERHNAANQRYYRTHGHVCVCGQLTSCNAHYCRSCGCKLRSARQRARRLTDDEKRDMARRAVVALAQHGQVGVRLLGGLRLEL